MRLFAFALAASMLCVPAVNAATFNAAVTIGDPLNSTEPGLVVKADDAIPANGAFTTFFTGNFDLAVGDNNSFDTFVLYTDETSVEAGDDAPKAFSVLFDLGAFGIAELFGSTRGENAPGGSQFGVLGYLGSALLDIGGGESLMISGLAGSFNAGAGALTPGRNNGIFATYVFELIETPVATVPLPAALPLTLAALGLLGAASRRRKVQVA